MLSYLSRNWLIWHNLHLLAAEFLCVYTCVSSYFYTMLSALSHKMKIRLASILFSSMQNSLSYLASCWSMLRKCRKKKKKRLLNCWKKTLSFRVLHIVSWKPQGRNTANKNKTKESKQQATKAIKNMGTFYPKMHI